MIPAASSVSVDESELVAAARNGDDRAFEALYSSYAGRILAYIGRMVGDHGRAEDISQEVFMSALGRLRQSEQPIAFKPWIYEIAKNACIDESRRTKRGREVPFGVDGDQLTDDRRLTALIPTPDAAVEGKQRLRDLQGAFDGLSEIQHEVLVLRELGGLSYREIGERLNMNRAMVESSLFRARRRLSEEYQELASGRRCQQIQTLIDECPSRPLQSFRVRERRQLTRHLSHCRPCRRMAMMAGFDQAALRRRSIAAKIPALLPFPLLRWRRADARPKATGSGTGYKVTALRPLQNVAQLADPAGPGFTVGRGAAAVAALAIAGVGGGVVTGLATVPHAARPSAAPAAPARIQQHDRSPVIGNGAARAVRAAHARQIARARPRAAVRSVTQSTVGTAHKSGSGRVGVTSAGRGPASGGQPRPSGGPTTRSASSSPTAAGGRGASAGSRSPVTSRLPATVAGNTGPVLSTGGSVTKPARSVAAGASTATRTGSVGSSAGSAVGSAGSALTGAPGTVVSKVGPTIGSVLGAAGSALGRTGAAVGATGTALGANGPAGGAVGSIVKSAGPVVKQLGSTVAKVGSGVVKRLGSVVSQTGSGVVKQVGSVVSQTGSAVAKSVGSAVSQTGSAVAKSVGSPVGNTGSAVSKAGPAVGSAASAVSKAGSAVGSAASAVSKAGSAVGSAASAVSKAGSAAGTVAAVSQPGPGATSTAPIPLPLPGL
jgi:RNA polymerase sigma factor (sigma-70 family)